MNALLMTKDQLGWRRSSMGTELEFRVDQIEEMNKCSAHLSSRFDDVIAELIMSREDDGAVPFIILAAMANVMIKLALLTDGKRETVLSVLNDFMPSNDELKELEAINQASGTVVPTSDILH